MLDALDAAAVAPPPRAPPDGSDGVGGSRIGVPGVNAPTGVAFCGGDAHATSEADSALDGLTGRSAGAGGGILGGSSSTLVWLALVGGVLAAAVMVLSGDAGVGVASKLAKWVAFHIEHM